jgi:CRP-like cAMP-binding protein
MTASMTSVLAQHSLLGQLDEATLASLAGMSFTKRLGRGQVLFSTGEPGDHLYVVAEGRLQISTRSTDSESFMVGIVGPGDGVGELAVIDEGPRSADVEAVEPSAVVAVPATAVRAALLAHPEVLLELAQELAADLRRTTGTASDLVFLDVRSRLAKLLLAEMAQATSDSVLDLGLNQSQVAARLGSTRQSLNRALAEMTRRGMIRLDGTRVSVLDRVALERLATR